MTLITHSTEHAPLSFILPQITKKMLLMYVLERGTEGGGGRHSAPLTLTTPRPLDGPI